MLVLTAEEMQNIDEYTMKELGISRDVLMEKAALSVADEIGTRKNPKVVCVCGIPSGTAKLSSTSNYVELICTHSRSRNDSNCCHCHNQHCNKNKADYLLCFGHNSSSFINYAFLSIIIIKHIMQKIKYFITKN